MQNQVGPSSKLLHSKKAVVDFVKEWDDVVIMGFFEKKTDEMVEKYLEANNDIRDDYRFGHTFDLHARKLFGFEKNAIALIQPEKFRSKYEDKYIAFKVSRGTRIIVYHNINTCFEIFSKELLILIHFTFKLNTSKANVFCDLCSFSSRVNILIEKLI